MAYDEDLAGRVRDILQGIDSLDEKKMFGGICFLHHGNMCCGISGDELIVRVGPDNHESALEEPNTKVFDITGRVMRGWVMVSPDGWDSDDQMSSWVDRGVSFAATLPPK